jgi:hypothetical protein
MSVGVFSRLRALRLVFWDVTSCIYGIWVTLFRTNFAASIFRVEEWGQPVEMLRDIGNGGQGAGAQSEQKGTFDP